MVTTGHNGQRTFGASIRMKIERFGFSKNKRKKKWPNARHVINRSLKMRLRNEIRKFPTRPRRRVKSVLNLPPSRRVFRQFLFRPWSHFPRPGELRFTIALIPNLFRARPKYEPPQPFYPKGTESKANAKSPVPKPPTQAPVKAVGPKSSTHAPAKAPEPKSSAPVATSESKSTQAPVNVSEPKPSSRAQLRQESPSSPHPRFSSLPEQPTNRPPCLLLNRCHPLPPWHRRKWARFHRKRLWVISRHCKPWPPSDHRNPGPID